MNYDRQYLHNAYNATSTGDDNGEIETYEHWLEKQLMTRLAHIDKMEQANDVKKSESTCNLQNVSGCYLVKFVHPDKEYPVNYTIKQDGTKVYKPQMLIGADLTENQIVELFCKQLL